jgi:hypothetical protein
MNECKPYVHCGRSFYRIISRELGRSIEDLPTYAEAAHAFWVMTAHRLRHGGGPDRYLLEDQTYQQVPIPWGRLLGWATATLEESGFTRPPPSYEPTQPTEDHLDVS